MGARAAGLGVGVLPWLALAGLLGAQPTLRIVSPADGATVHPGETFVVTVDVSPPEGAFRIVFVSGTESISFSKEKLKAPPYRFTLQIPDGTAPGEYYVTAGGSARIIS